MINQLIQAFKPKSSNVTISVSFDNKYLDYGKILLNSLIKNSPDVKVVVLAINIPENDLKKFAEIENIKVIHENKNFLHAYEQRLYVTTRRIFLINELRQDSSTENLLQLDADAIVKRNLNRFGTLFQQGDFCIFARPKMKHEALRLTMNVLGLSNSSVAKELTQEWVKQLWKILEEPQQSKYIDQLTLWKAYEKVNQEYGVKLVNLGTPWIGSSRNTIIRTFYATKNAKGDRKLLKELNKFTENYLKEAPSNAPAKPEETEVFLTRSLLSEHFEKFGLSAS
ncbi:conserved hypothetical protein [Hyella patelloides LEGE 07179]|uniref:Nucleotide-diphospho-sugar transferase domain-containing protein n=1 Tax=Hyella patelloides LEGE 07179 TaxID=945734 RepID=A0A563VLG7_9CYAN|nr:hypothetical protein [Hyella patelloides]VEP12262.1 conserved hypothetical protein [Hyella patelloides LEGE 07179]